MITRDDVVIRYRTVVAMPVMEGVTFDDWLDLYREGIEPLTADNSRFTCIVCGCEAIGRYYMIGIHCSKRCERKARAEKVRLTRPSRAKEKIAKRCEYCDASFTPSRQDAKTCSVKCHVAAHRKLKKLCE